MKTKKQVKAAAKEKSRSFSGVVGADTYEVWVSMLRKLVPDGRTHRLAVMLAGMLQYAVVMAAAKKTPLPLIALLGRREREVLPARLNRRLRNHTFDAVPLPLNPILKSRAAIR